MKIVSPSVEIMTAINGEEILRHIEVCGRVCYKSEDKITPESSKNFIGNIINRGHESVLEHYSITVRFICDRGVSHEIVRHRIASYSQESTRYCNYGKQDEITVIKPLFFDEGTPAWANWEAGCKAAETAYMELLAQGRTPQEARSVLPNSLKTEVVMTANLREWRHFFRLRCAKAAHPQMREVARPLLCQFQAQIPVLFADITFDN